VSSPAAPVASFQEAEARARANADAAREVRQHLEQTEGGVDGFLQRVRIAPIAPPGGAELRDFHAVLAEGILPYQLVPIGDFVDAIGVMNDNTLFQQALGPYRYVCLAARTDADGTIGVAGLIVFCHHDGPATLHASYYAISPAFRSIGLGRRLLNAAADIAMRFVATARPAAWTAGPLVHFIETSSYPDMTLAERLADEAIALHPLVRDEMWERIGFREIRSAGYHQRATPPAPLVLKALLIEPVFRRMIPPTSIDGDLVRRHVTAFDAVLMNSEAASEALARGHAPPRPEPAGLLAWLPPGAVLPVVSPEDAARDRCHWRALDASLRTAEQLRLGTTLRALGHAQLH
jgi:GNAT superfamily N-acetyltransferase